jgi:hypothetical protein
MTIAPFLDAVGTVAALVIAFVLLHRYRAAPRARRLPGYAYAGAVILFAGQYLTLFGVTLLAVYFTPLAWTGYILWVDGAIYTLRGRSLLKNYRAEFAGLALCSIPLWLLFEAYNLRLANWIYVGLPQNWAARLFGYGWAFATIWPAIFETASLLRALEGASFVEGRSQPMRTPSNRSAATIASLAGVVFLTVPLLVPADAAPYLFGAVWLGFILLLEPINLRTNRESLLRDWLGGNSSRLKALLWAGMICGVFWEFWNHWAAARWFYTVPLLPEYKVFAMPLLGYAGFPAFALECFAMFAFVAPYLNRISQLGRRNNKLDWAAVLNL